VLFGSVDGSKNKIPLPNLSGGINRFIWCMLPIASRHGSVVLIDEVENGIYYSHFPALWRGMLKFLRDFKGQAFVTTHSKECLNGLVKAAAKDVSDIALWRTEIEGGEYIVRQFTGAELRAGIDYGEEVR
jgi:AAA15 family ATPase/GTPase